ncbi:uncharacterized protein K02A2.6-like [Photinus pyralis]|uniref:uncharacterized protein K02A2.6-like n=1 Tax=Photinus pyralis TaxID=7054 RepID=UPI00126771F7|nr:uncharacterized protein K02A2.6-like [Photinus pyralis]
MNRLSFGIKTAPSEFNRILDQILQGLEGTMSYFDDIIIHGTSHEECQNRLRHCLERLRKYDLHLNKDKCTFFQTEIQYLGYIIRQNKISKCPKKVEAINSVPRPRNADEVRRFLGMVTYYSRFIPDASTMTHPLRQLLRKDKQFFWSSSCESAFIKLKTEISSERVLVPFDPNLPITLACDASPTGIAGVLSNIIDGVERPVAFISRSLTQAETNYSQLDREALAIVFTVGKFYNYIYGQPFTLITDNRPLTRIFHQNAKLPAMTSARLLRYAAFLQQFNYEVQHRKAEDHVNVDFFSRAPSNEKSIGIETTLDQELQNLNDQVINQISTYSLTSTSIAFESQQDPELSKIKESLIHGNLNNPDYSLHDGVIFKGQRVVIPTSLRAEVLKELHHTHVGIVKMKQLARRYCYWRNIDKDIENLVRQCENCALIKKDPVKAPVHHWDEPKENFEQVHIDYAGPFQGFYFLVLVDSKSKWAEVKVIKEAPTSESTIYLLQDIFSVHGLPRNLVSDNATIFHSDTFQTFCRENGIMQKFIAPGHPATNGLAERNIQTLKQKLTAMADEKLSMNQKVREILYRYRGTPLNCGKTPAQLYLGRDIRLKLDALRPSKEPASKPADLPRVRNFSVGERVQVRWYTNQKPTWKFGVVLKNVQPKKKVTFQDNIEDQPKPMELEEIIIRPDNYAAVPDQGNVPVMAPPAEAVPQAAPPAVQIRRSQRQRQVPRHFQDYVRD